MTIVFITDIHGRSDGFDRLPAADVAVLGGDLTQFGTPVDVRRILDLAASRFPQLLAVLGNCDPPAGEAVLAERGLGLHRRSVLLGGVAFAGLGGSNTTPFRTPYEWRDEEAAAAMDAVAVPEAGVPLVLVSHAPPRNSGADRLPSGASAGSEAVAAWVRARRPNLVLCGHIHEAVGQFDFGGLPVVNPGAFRAGGYAVVEIGPGGAVTRIELSRV
jgi:Icc-related predicted phosphoesterase